MATSRRSAPTPPATSGWPGWTRSRPRCDTTPPTSSWWCALGRPGTTRVNGAPVDTALLRTASRLDIGDWTMSFYREEYADHGRPYGGRVGGEIGHQRRQPARHLRHPHPEENAVTSAGPVLVAGASGFVGRRLCPALDEAGHGVRAMTRHPDSYTGEGEAVYGDVHDADSLAQGARGLPRRLLPGALAGLQGLRAARRRGGPRVRQGRRRGRGAADHLPRRSRQRRPTSSPRTCAAAARSRGCSARPGSRSPCCGPGSSWAAAASRGR